MPSCTLKPADRRLGDCQGVVEDAPLALSERWTPPPGETESDPNAETEMERQYAMKMRHVIFAAFLMLCSQLQPRQPM